MNVEFKYGSTSNLGNLAITDGQIIACSNTGAMYYDIGGVRRPVYTLPQGTASIRGGVKLSDAYTSSAGTAAAGVGASSYAVYSCYSSLTSLYYDLKQDTADGKALIAATISGYGYNEPTADATFEELADAASDAIYLAQVAGSDSKLRVATMPGLEWGRPSISGNYAVYTFTVDNVDSSFPYVTFILPGAIYVTDTDTGYSLSIYGHCAQGQSTSVNEDIATVCWFSDFESPIFNLSWADSNNFTITLKIDKNMSYSSDECIFIFSDTAFGFPSGSSGSLYYVL